MNTPHYKNNLNMETIIVSFQSDCGGQGREIYLPLAGLESRERNHDPLQLLGQISNIFTLSIVLIIRMNQNREAMINSTNLHFSSFFQEYI